MADTVNSIILAWATSKAYAVRDVVNNGGSYYRCNTAHTSGATFAADSSKWTALSPSPTGTVYSSFSAWDAARAGAIGSGDREVADMYAGEHDAIFNSTSWSGAGKAVIRAATSQDRCDGKWGNGVRNNYSGPYCPAALNNIHWEVDGVAMRQLGDNADYPVIYSVSQPLTYINNLLISDNDTANSHVVKLTPGVGVKAVVANCVLIHNGASASAALTLYTGNCYVYNCAAVAASGLALGSWYQGGSSAVKNTYMHGPTCYAANDGQPEVSFTTSRHSTSQSITGSTGSTAYSTANFTNVTSGSEDLSLPSGSALIDAGTDLSGDADYPFSTDILGNTRSGTWDIGPFEYAPSGGVPFFFQPGLLHGAMQHLSGGFQ